MDPAREGDCAKGGVAVPSASRLQQESGALAEGC